MLTTYETDGTVDRKDWQLVCGTAGLVKGATYYLSGIGMLALSGTQQIGVATSKNTLRIQVQTPTTQLSVIHPVDVTPAASLGKVGDFAFAKTSLSFFGPKTAEGWGGPARMIQTSDPAPPYFRKVNGMWACS